MTTDRATLLETINASPLIMSLLYDLNLMPETTPEGSAIENRMLSVVVHFNVAAAEIATLRAQVADMRKDAARYRWLRMRGVGVIGGEGGFCKPFAPSLQNELDAYINTAISGSETK